MLDLVWSRRLHSGMRNRAFLIDEATNRSPRARRIRRRVNVDCVFVVVVNVIYKLELKNYSRHYFQNQGSYYKTILKDL